MHFLRSENCRASIHVKYNMSFLVATHSVPWFQNSRNTIGKSLLWTHYWCHITFPVCEVTWLLSFWSLEVLGFHASQYLWIWQWIWQYVRVILNKALLSLICCPTDITVCQQGTGHAAPLAIWCRMQSRTSLISPLCVCVVSNFCFHSSSRRPLYHSSLPLGIQPRWSDT